MSLGRLLNFLWRHNPVTRIVYSEAHKGLKIIGLSLVLVLVSAAPVFIAMLVNPAVSPPHGLSLLFAIGALVAHAGFIVGLLWLLRDHFFRR